MYRINSGNDSFEIKPLSENKAGLNGEIKELDIIGKDGHFHLILNHKSYNLEVVSADYESKSFEIKVNNNTYSLEAKDKFDLLLEKLGMKNLNATALNDLKAPMPGLVLSVNAAVGQEVSKGDALLVLEAMKMENVLKALNDGVVKSVLAEPGKAVEKNQTLIEFE